MYDRVIYVAPEHVQAWKHWKALQNPTLASRRAKLGISLSPEQVAEIRAKWVEAGGG